MDTTPIVVPLWAVEQIEVLGRQCADGGACHHGCTTECFRKQSCGTLSACTYILRCSRASNLSCGTLSACTWLNEDWTPK